MLCLCDYGVLRNFRRRTAILSFSRASSDASDSKTLAKDKSRQSKHAALASISARRHATHAQGHPSSSAIASAHLLRTQISKGVPESSKSFEDSSAVAAPVQHGGLEASHVNNVARAPQARARARRRAAERRRRRRDARRVPKLEKEAPALWANLAEFREELVPQAPHSYGSERAYLKHLELLVYLRALRVTLAATLHDSSCRVDIVKIDNKQETGWGEIAPATA